MTTPRVHSAKTPERCLGCMLKENCTVRRGAGCVKNGKFLKAEGMVNTKVRVYLGLLRQVQVIPFWRSKTNTQQSGIVNYLTSR